MVAGFSGGLRAKREAKSRDKSLSIHYRYAQPNRKYFSCMKRQNNTMINGGSRQQASFLSVAGPGRAPPPPPFFLDQTGARRSKLFFLDRVPPYLRVWMTGPPLTEGLDPPLLIPMIVIAKASLRISEKSGKNTDTEH